MAADHLWQVGDAVKAILVDAKSGLKSLVASATSFASDDQHCPAGILIKALKANGFTELVCQLLRAFWEVF
jgi:hypothetical protein